MYTRWRYAVLLFVGEVFVVMGRFAKAEEGMSVMEIVAMERGVGIGAMKRCGSEMMGSW